MNASRSTLPKFSIIFEISRIQNILIRLNSSTLFEKTIFTSMTIVERSSIVSQSFVLGFMKGKRVVFTPTVEHCNMASLIGLCLKRKLMKALPKRWEYDYKMIRRMGV